MAANQIGISTDKLNEKMLKAAEVLKPLGMVIKSLDVRFQFSEVSE